MADETVFEETKAPSAEERAEFQDELTDWAAIAIENRKNNPALRNVQRHVYPGAPFGGANDPGFEKYK